MTEDIDTLLAIAEIAGVFVGFAALVTILTRGQAEPEYDDSFRLANVILTSVMVIAAAIVPVVLNRYGFAESAVWRASSSLLFVYNWFALFLLRHVVHGFARAHSRRPVLSTTLWALEALFQIPLLLCIVGAWQGLAAAFYLTALAVALFQMSLTFAHLTTSLILRERR